MPPRRRIFWAVTLACASFLLLKNLGEVYLWEDEADTAVLGVNILRFGLPRVFDGRNLDSQNLNLDHDSHMLPNYATWLADYAAAPSIGLLGKNTFAARLPFALLGIVNLFWIHWFALRWSRKQAVADWTAWLTLLSVPYLLYARQCHYYMLSLFFFLYVLYAYEGMLEGRRGAGWHLTASSVGVFHSSYYTLYTIGGSLAAHFAALVRGRLAWLKRNAVWFILTAACLLPALLFFKVRGRAVEEAARLWPHRLENLRAFAGDLDLYFFPFGLALLCSRLKGRFERLKTPLAYLSGACLFLLISPRYFARYFICLVPLFSFFAAEAIAQFSNAWLRAGALACLLFSHAFSLQFWLGRASLFNSDLVDFLREITHPFPEPLKAATRYLNQHADPDDLVVVSYPELPFMFYTPLRVIGGSSGPHRVRLSDVKWIVLRSDDEKASFPFDYSRYEKIPLDVQNAPWGNRPEPGIHYFQPPRTPEPASIYRLKD